MKLKQADLDMLPAWVKSGKNTVQFLEWILDDRCFVWETLGHILVKIKQGKFLFLYLSEKKSGSYITIKQGLAFCGLFYTGNYELYDVQVPLLYILGMQQDAAFQSKENAVRFLEQEVSDKIGDIIRNHWYDIIAEKKYEVHQLIPALNFENVKSIAEKFYLDGWSIEEVTYKPKFSFGQQIPDTYYLMYLEHGEHTVNVIAKQWIRKHLPEISKERIYFGCIREQMREIPSNGRLAKVRQIRSCLTGLENETVHVKIDKNEKTLYIRVKAKELMARQGRYSLTCFPTRDRLQYEKLFGKSVLLQIEDIKSVSLFQKVLYIQKGQEAA